MAVTSPPRRSARARKTNTFKDQVSWADATALLRAPSDSPDRSSDSSEPESIQQVDDDNFDEQAAEVEEREDADEVEDLNEDDEMDGRSESVSVHAVSPMPTSTPRNYAAMFKAGVKRYSSSKAASKPIVFPRPKEKEWSKAQGLRNRRLQQDKERLRGHIKTAMMESFGPELEDLYPVIRGREIWSMENRDLVLPSRASIKEALKLELQGKYLYQKKDSTQHEHPMQNLIVAKCGKFKPITFDEVISRSYYHAYCRNEAVLGYWDQGQKTELHISTPINITNSYTMPSNTLPNPSRKLLHRGWLLNLGARAQSLAWAQTTSDVQYLAVAFKSTERQRQATSATESATTSAFSPSSSYPGHIQILRVQATSSESSQAAHMSHDVDSGPLPQRILCMEWGDILSIAWSPLSLPDSISKLERALVVLASDGCVRVICVNLESAGNEVIIEPDRIARPPTDTIFTCFYLPSHIDLIVGDATGTLHLFNLACCPLDGSLTAYATYRIHHTYITAITVAADSPHIVCSQSAAGEMVLTDLRSPMQDRVAIHKARLASRNLVYYPFARTFITTSDSAGNSEATGSSLGLVVGHNMRHFYQTQWLLKLPECSGLTTAFAASQFHPIILAANASGMVFASNVLKRLLPIGWKSEENKVQSYMVKVCEIDWIEMPKNHDLSGTKENSANENESEQSRPINLYHGRESRPGVMWLHESFQPTRVEVSNAASKSASGRTPKSVTAEREATSQITLPEEQAVTAMAWNPNSRFSGWAAIAWGNGVICIKDLAHDLD